MGENIEQRVKNIVVEQLGVNPEQVTREARFVDDLEMDSLDVVQVVMAIEDTFGIQVPDDATEHMSTVQDAVDAIREAVNQ